METTMLLQEAVPNTTGYMLLAYSFLLGLPILYVISWVVRRRNLERDLEMLESLKADEQKRTAATPSSPTRPPESTARQLP
jgi:hypothetical protein